MKIKLGVILAGLAIDMRPALMEADKLWAAEGQELVVTCGLDGTHSAGSLHYYGLALDFRTWYFPKAQHRRIAAELQAKLGGDFDVVLHSSHLHCEFDPITPDWDGP